MIQSSAGDGSKARVSALYAVHRPDYRRIRSAGHGREKLLRPAKRYRGARRRDRNANRSNSSAGGTAIQLHFRVNSPIGIDVDTAGKRTGIGRNKRDAKAKRLPRTKYRLRDPANNFERPGTCHRNILDLYGSSSRVHNRKRKARSSVNRMSSETEGRGRRSDGMLHCKRMGGANDGHEKYNRL